MTSNREQCKATRRDGERCKGAALESGYCFAHDESLQATREEARRRGGQNRAAVIRLRGLVPPRLSSVFDTLEAALTDVQAGKISPQQASAMAAVSRAMVSVLSAGELEERVRGIERRVNGGSENRWQA